MFFLKKPDALGIKKNSSSCFDKEKVVFGL